MQAIPPRRDCRTRLQHFHVDRHVRRHLCLPREDRRSTYRRNVHDIARNVSILFLAPPLPFQLTHYSVSNLGGTFPRFFILRFVDLFTSATCIPPTTPPEKSSLKGDLITAPFNCALEAEKHRCINGGGTCNIERDGYYIVNILCVVFGVVTFWGFIKPRALHLQSLPLRAWRVSEG